MRLKASEHAIPKRKGSPYLGAKTRERAVEEIATGTRVPRELSATSALSYKVSILSPRTN